MTPYTFRDNLINNQEYLFLSLLSAELLFSSLYLYFQFFRFLPLFHYPIFLFVTEYLVYLFH